VKSIILGGGGCAREIISFLREANTKVFGYIALKDDGAIFDALYLSDSLTLYSQESVDYYIASGDPNIRMKMSEELTSMGLFAKNFFHSSSYINQDAIISPYGVIIYPGATINVEAHLKNSCLINCGVSVGHGAIIGANSVICPGAKISGNVKIGDNVFVGANAVINENISVVSGVVIGSGAIVIESISEIGTYVGVPAKKV
jgi:sugar O-acyltransferase (sialic acid O-acetyltransferase NeuD family)